MIALQSLVTLLLALAGANASNDDEITDLPGLSFKPKFKHYSGYLQASPTRFHHYWFVESQGDPAKDPLVFWFNGGPGCSSLEGLLAEHGPYFLANGSLSLVENPHAWNKFSNVVYMESPAGVGFSYATEGDDGSHDDKLTSAENYEAIKNFLKKYPQFRNHSVFIAGESYGGMYVPFLTERIVDGQKDFPINLKGISIGNGLLNANLDASGLVEFLYAHGYVDELVYRDVASCCNGDVGGCDLGNLNESCTELFLSIRSSFEELALVRQEVNFYDVYRDCQVPTDLALPLHRTTFKSALTKKPMAPAPSKTCNPEFGPYLNQPKVRAALHIPEHVEQWQECNMTLNTAYPYSDDVHPQITKIVDNGVRVLLYYGDTDAACNFIGGQKFAASLGLKQVKPKHTWHFDGRLGGFNTEYEKNLTFLTVRGVGHMVPQWQPAGAQYFIQKFLRNEAI